LQKSFDTEAFSSLQIDPSNLRHKLNTHLHKSSIYIWSSQGREMFRQNSMADKTLDGNSWHLKPVEWLWSLDP